MFMVMIVMPGVIVMMVVAFLMVVIVMPGVIVVIVLLIGFFCFGPYGFKVHIAYRTGSSLIVCFVTFAMHWAKVITPLDQ